MSESLGALYKEGAALLQEAGVTDASHDARALLAHVFGCKLNDVLLRADEPAPASEAQIYRHLISLRAGRMPLQYVTRTAYFGGMELRSDDRALIPRQETENLVEAVLARLPMLEMGPDDLIADIGCGAGPIGLMLAARLPGQHVVMSDISAAAVELAGENAARVGLQDRVTLLQGSYLEPLRDAGLLDRVVIVVCNPPYVRPGEMKMLDPELHVEPRVAIASPATDGLDGYRVMAEQARWLPRLRLMAFEMGFGQEPALTPLFEPLGRVEILTDFSEIERMVIVHVG
jgi:release factor glutamine methyltransferase